MTKTLDARAAHNLDRGRHAELTAWLREHLDPNDVSAIAVEGDELVATVFDRNDEGRRYVAAHGKAATRVVRMPLKSPPPEWL